MSYTPNNVDIYTAAFAGVMAGRGIFERDLKNSQSSTYTLLSQVAGAWAQAFDTVWASGNANELDVQLALEFSAGYWDGRAIQNNSSIISTTYISAAEVLVAAIQAGETYFASQGITPPDVGGGGVGSGDISHNIDRVKGLQSIPLTGISGDHPTIGGNWWYDEVNSNSYKKQSLGQAVFYVDAYGAIADSPLDGTGTDNADAFEAAIKALDVYGGGIVMLSATGPNRGYRLGRTVNVTRNVIIAGQGGPLFYPGSLVIADAGVTAFRLWGNATGPNGDGAADSCLRDITIFAAGQLTTSTSGDYVQASFNLTVDDPGDFENGQLIAIEGCGPKILLSDISATVAMGSHTVTVDETGGQTAPFVIAGQYIIIGAAYPTPSKVSSWNNDGTITMVDAAAADVTAGNVFYCAAFVTRIVSGAGSNNWVIDSQCSTSVTDFSGATINHADAGLDVLVRCNVERVSIGNGVKYFQGPAIAVRGDHQNIPSTNANLCRFVYQSYANRNAIYVIGIDSNACEFHISSLQSRDWAVAEYSGLGNTYIGCHVDSTLGYITVEFNSNQSIFVGCYTEGGGGCSFGSGAAIVGGSMPIFVGGYRWGNTINRMNVGNTSFTAVRTTIDPLFGYITFQSATSPGALELVPTDTDTPGFFHFIHTSTSRSHPLSFADNDQTAFRAGTLWIPADCWFGEDVNRTYNTTVGARLASYRSDLDGTGAVINDPVAGPYENNIYIQNTHAPIWKKGDWIRDPNLLDGAPTRHIIEPGHRAPEWQASTEYFEFGEICPTVNSHSGSFFIKLTVGGQLSGLIEPDWTTAPNPGDTLVDGAITWTNGGDAAYTQPVELDGYIVYKISDSASWSQTARQFLCGSVEITGALSGDATITLPTGRYKRWIWNHTTGGHDLIFTTSMGNTVTIANGKGAEIGCDGLQIIRRTSDITPA